MELTFIGRDSWDRPVYKSGTRLFVDVEPISTRAPAICTKQGNNIDGEPLAPVENTQFTFTPHRDTWR